MPCSAPEGKEFIRHFVWALDDVEKIVDVGVGCGTYANILGNRYYYIGIEAYEPYLNQFSLGKKYNEMIVDDVRNIELPDADLIIFGDVLEHMPKEDAIQLLERSLKYKHCVISVPWGPMPQGAVGGNEYERHVAEWNRGDLPIFDGFDQHIEGHIGVFVR